MNTYDLVVIGTGTAAQVASARVQAAGWSVAVIDHRPFGGTCALRGCDPKKMLVSAAEAIDAANRMQGHGVVGQLRVSWADLIAFKRTFTDPVPTKHEQRYRAQGIDAYHGRARFNRPRVVEVDATALEGRSVLIATGARPAPLGFPGEEHVITSDQFLELESLPERIDLVGGGYITAEFSHIAARAGARVTSLQRGEQILPKFDPDLVGWLMEKFVAADVEVRTSTTVEKVERTDGACRVHARTSGHEITVEADLVVHAAGRVPDLDALSVAAEGHGLAGEHCELWLNASPAASFLGAVFEDSPASQCDAPLSLELRRGRGTP